MAQLGVYRICKLWCITHRAFYYDTHTHSANSSSLKKKFPWVEINFPFLFIHSKLAYRMGFVVTHYTHLPQCLVLIYHLLPIPFTHIHHPRQYVVLFSMLMAYSFWYTCLHVCLTNFPLQFSSLHPFLKITFCSLSFLFTFLDASPLVQKSTGLKK